MHLALVDPVVSNFVYYVRYFKHFVTLLWVSAVGFMFCFWLLS